MEANLRSTPAERTPAKVLERIFRSELNAFMASIDQTPVTLEQDMRAGVVAFIATFASEILGQSSIALFNEAMHELWDRPAFLRDEWWKVAFLSAGHSNLFGNRDAIDVVERNIGTGNRNIRNFLYAPLGLALDHLHRSGGAFDDGMMQNFRSRHMGNDEGIAILVASKLTAEEKLATLERWKREASGSDVEYLDSAIRMRGCRHTLLTEYAGIALHLAEVALALPQTTWDDPQMNLLDGTLSLQEVMARIRTHPLFSSYVSM
jgi:hypothetical protein